MKASWILWTFLLAMSMAACVETVTPSDELGSDEATPDNAPLLGSADGMDSADVSCQIVLVELTRHADSQGYLWYGTLDMATSAQVDGSLPAVLYRPLPWDAWYRINATPTYGGPTGYQRFLFNIQAGPQDAGIELIPFLYTPWGARTFDHNRVGSDNYMADASNGYRIASDASVCSLNPGTTSTTCHESAIADVEFKEDWTIDVAGALVEGGQMNIRYDLDRLPNCRGTHNGFPAWNITAYVQFQPSGTIDEESVREFQSINGRPTTIAYERVASFDIPWGTTGIEVWFDNTSVSGSWCQEWDSNYSENYLFDVAASSCSAP